jgi:hypothetical protein
MAGRLGGEPRTYSFKIECVDCFPIVRKMPEYLEVLRKVTAGSWRLQAVRSGGLTEVERKWRHAASTRQDPGIG